MKHLFEEKGPGCPIPPEYQEKITFLEALAAIKDNDKVILCFDFYKQAKKITSRIKAGEFVSNWILDDISDIKMICDASNGLRSISHGPGYGALLSRDDEPLVVNCADIFDKEKEWIVGDRNKLLSFAVRYWRVQEERREISKMREIRDKKIK